VNRLATIANIVAVKEASPQSVARVKMIDGRLSVLSGDDINSLAVMLAGGKGVISVVANVAPRQMKEMCQAALQGDQETATAINAQLMPLHQQLFVESNPIPVKWALEQMGRIAPGIRLPLTVLSESKRSVVSAALQQAKIV
jgi:4-hydroxy-tetrahydrodipicolinate synthase